MKIIMVAAISKDGFLTKGLTTNPGVWTSDEDKQFYKSLLAENNLYLAGCNTYWLAKNTLPAHAIKIVMCHNVSDQPKMPNVRFTDKSFVEVFDAFSAQHSQALVIGGASIYHQLLEQSLIDEVYLTIEPVIHKTGVRLCSSQYYFENFGFELINNQVLNDNGTILKHYVLKK